MTDIEQRNARAMLSAQAAYESPPDAPPLEWQEIEQSINWCEDKLGRAERAMRDGDICAARDLLIEAARDLLEEMGATR